MLPSNLDGRLRFWIWIVDTEYGVHSIVFHVGPNPDDPTHKSDLALIFPQGNIFLVREAFHVVIFNDGSAEEVIRPLELDGLCSCDGGSIAANKSVHLGILTTTHA